jgi:Ser/Thr protein kinase RdoA (MazF antagonist)
MSVPGPVLAAWGWDHAETTAITGGLINATFDIHDGTRHRGVLQRLHPVFAPEVNLDVEAVTAHVAARGLPTPRLIRTTGGDAWLTHDAATWRALTWVDGETVHRVPDPAWAEVAGAFVGEFHRALVDFTHDYAFARAGVHDTPAHLARLRAEADRAAPGEARELAREILAAAAALPELPATPRRHGHGDLKISNVMFHQGPLRAACLVDLDTVGLTTLAFELGDAMRSWCNPQGEDAGRIAFELPIFAAAMRGFRGVADPIVTSDERRSIVLGLETVCVELAARFCVDAFRDEYFGWDPARFPSRVAHNLVRARGQLALGMAVRAARSDALEIVLG